MDAALRSLAASILQDTLAAGCRRFCVASAAVAGDDDVAISVDDFVAIRAAAAMVGVNAIDHVVVGDNGWSSLLRQGAIDATDARYR